MNDSVDPAGALQRLRDKLANAGRVGGREAVPKTLFGVYDYLMDIGLQRTELLPLLDICAALNDHEKGKEIPLIAVRTRSGSGNKAYSADNMFKCYVAVMMKSGIKKPKACTEVYKFLNGAGIKLTPANVRTWHHELSNERHADEMVNEDYRVILDHMLNQADLTQTARGLLDYLPTVKRKLM